MYTRILSAFNLLKRVGFAVLLLLLSCDKETEFDPVAPEVEFFVEGKVLGAGDTVEVASGIEVGIAVRARLEAPIEVRLRLIGQRGDTLVDTTANQTLDSDTLRVVPVFAEADTLVWAHVTVAELPAPEPLVILPRDVAVEVSPSSGTAPLATTTTVRVWTELALWFALDFENDGAADTTVTLDEFSPLQEQTFTFSRAYPVFDDTLKVTIRYRGSPPRQSTRAVRIQSQNSPPFVTQDLPVILYSEDLDSVVRDLEGNDLSVINLNQYFGDLQSPLTFSATGEAPFDYSIQDSMMYLSVRQNGNGSGELPITATDANNASATRGLEYYVDPMTDIPLQITRIGSSAALPGTVTVEGVDYYVDSSSPIVNVQVSPNQNHSASARFIDNGPQSYLRTSRFDASNDVTTTLNIPVSTYENIGEGFSTDDYKLFVGQISGRVINPDGTAILQSIPFDSAGYWTVHIAANGFNGYSMTPAEQDSVRNQIVTEIYNATFPDGTPVLRPEQHIPVYLATPQDTLPYQEGVGGPLHTIVIGRDFSSWATSVDDDNNGSIDRATIGLSYLGPQHTLQEVLTALCAKNHPYFTTPTQSILTEGSTRTDLSINDKKHLYESANRTPGLIWQDVYGE